MQSLSGAGVGASKNNTSESTLSTMARRTLLFALLATALPFAHSFTRNPLSPPSLSLTNHAELSIGFMDMNNGSPMMTTKDGSRDLGRRSSMKTKIYNFLSNDEIESTSTTETSKSWPLICLSGTISFFYWYWLVLGALAVSQGMPFVPDWIPLTPGWPPMDADLEPVLADSQNFFYLSTLLQNPDAPYVQPVRLAAFNVAEAWIFAFLPLLWADGKRRLNKWGLLATWGLLGINLTNAFMAPYIFLTEFNSNEDADAFNAYKNRWVSATFGGISSLVGCHAALQCASTATVSDWNEMMTLIQTDRTYTAFAVDLCLFSFFQPVLLSRVRPDGQRKTTDHVPFVGLMAWLFERD